METPQPIDYQVVLNDLLAKRAKLDAAIEAVQEMLGQGTGSTPTVVQVAHANSADFASDAFFKMSVPDATRKFLSMMKRPCGTKEIVEALERGGLTHNSENFYTTVHSTLMRREESTKDFCRVKRKWALTEWYGQRKGQRPSDSDGAEQ